MILLIAFFITFSINKSGPVLDIAFHDKANDDHPGIEYQTKGQSQDASPSHLIVLSQILPGRVKGHYCAEVACCPEVSAMILPRPRNTARLKIRPLGSSQIGGGSVLISLSTCTKKIIGNRVTVGQYFRKIWCL